MSKDEIRFWLFSKEYRSQIELQNIGPGQAVLWSSRSPDREGPNQDAALMLHLDKKTGFLAVADGVGGAKGATAASDIGVTKLKDSIVDAYKQKTDISGNIIRGFEEANQAVLELGIGAASAFASVEIFKNTIRTYHSGDCAIILVGQKGKMKYQNTQHSPTGYLVESGNLSEEEALNHEERHLVSNVLGSRDLKIEIGAKQELATNDTLILSTDGVHDNVTTDEMMEITRSGPLEEAADQLAKLCFSRMKTPEGKEPSKPDDMTFILYRLS